MKSLIAKAFNYCRRNPLDASLIIVLLLAILGLLWQYQATQVDEDWDRFISEHHCTSANKFKDDKTLKSGWMCDDGKTYYRWRQQL